MSSASRCLRAIRPLTHRGLAIRSLTRPALAYHQKRGFSGTIITFEKRYTKDHEWIDVNPEKKTGVIGISEYAAEQLGDVVYVELPETGGWVNGGDVIGAVESVKSAADINSPIRCKITQVNEFLEEKPGTINKVPEDDSNGGGWVAKVEVDEKSIEELGKLMSTDDYAAFVQDASH